MPNVRSPWLVRVAANLWVDPAEVVAIHEEYYEGSQAWQTRIYMRHDRTPFTANQRATDVIAALTGEDLR